MSRLQARAVAHDAYVEGHLRVVRELMWHGPRALPSRGKHPLPTVRLDGSVCRSATSSCTSDSELACFRSATGFRRRKHSCTGALNSSSSVTGGRPRTIADIVNRGVTFAFDGLFSRDVQ